ncbi:Helicase, C-terminal [Dillenia turbinata]|uniref:Helicase, C-terminal n=1 Tax=Dillenia turbinata TaxID=194707 RepID=A0AAN8Z7R2_9MAGN
MAQVQQQSSRLHRLLTLLDAGSTQATRFAAARQIGDIAKSHPQDLNSLLRKVSKYLHSKKWDTRVAAAHAIGAIAENVKHTTLTDLFACIETKMLEAGYSGVAEDIVALCTFHPKITASLSFQSFDINKVLEFGALLASGGQEYDLATDNAKNPRERLARQKQNLRRRLGLDMCEQFMDVTDVIRDEDLVVQKNESHGNGIDHRFYGSRSVYSIQQLVTNVVPGYVSKRPSARELNLLKRKAKTNIKEQGKGWSEDVDGEISCFQSVTTPKGHSQDSATSKVLIDTTNDEDSFNTDGDGRWPFHGFVEQLILDMFDAVWEVRHGSVMALREILSHQGASAGVLASKLSSSFGASSVDVNDEGIFDPMKRGRDIDLNMQVPAEETEPKLKRPKLEDISAPFVDPVINAKLEENFGIMERVDDGGISLPGDINGQVDAGTIKVDLESCLNVKDPCNKGIDMAEPEHYLEEKGSNQKLDLLKMLPENSELMNLVKLTRHSWLKNCEFLQDCAIRFLCILSLDRFGDYVSDQVVAPVRETCAQALGAVLKYMHPTLVHETLNILLQMQSRPEWEIRHGSLLGIKYLVAVREEMLNDLLARVLPACKAGLEDPDDDVRAVAADTLIPTAGAIVSLKGQTLYCIVMLLWDILLDLDDLSPSTGSVMNLLAEIYSQEDMIPKALSSEGKLDLDLNEIDRLDEHGDGITLLENPQKLSTLAPRLWPFMRHSITSVRHSAIQTLERLLEAGYKRKVLQPSDSSFWPSCILGDTLRIVFQNMLLESNDEILQCSERVWRLLLQCPVADLETAAAPFVSSWMELATTPYGSALDASKMFWPVALPRKSHHKAAAKMRAVKMENDCKDSAFDHTKGMFLHERNGDASTNSLKIIVGADVDKSVTHTRVVAATALGIFASKLHEESLQYIVNPLWKVLTSLSGVQRQVASMVLISWFKEIQSYDASNPMFGFIITFKNWLLDLLACSDPSFPTKESPLPYSELSRTYAKMRTEASQLFRAVESSGLGNDFFTNNKIDLENLTVDDAINFASNLPSPSNNGSGEDPASRNVADDMESAKQRLLTTAGYLKCVQGNLHVAVTALIAAAVVWMSELPSRLNPIILPLMASIKREQEEILQQKAAEALAELIYHCIARKPGPNDKLIKNLCSLTCADPCETPQAAVVNSMEIVEAQDLLSFGSATGNPKAKVHMLAGGEDRSRAEGFISRRGSELALRHLCKKFGASLFEKLPKLWDCITEVLKPSDIGQGTSDDDKTMLVIESVKDPQILINNIQVARSIAPMLDDSLKQKLLTLLPCIFNCVRHSHVAVRLAAARCITSMAKSMTISVMGVAIENIIPMLGDTTSVHARQGAGMLVSLLLQGLGVELVPYASLLVVPLLRCMGDCDHSVRQSVTRSFAALVPLLPLARGVSPPVGLGEDLSKNTEDAKFLEQLLDNSHIDDYQLSTELKVTLRRYQQEGINWLAFLRRFKLHGILCDDMGLGKTLQASAIVASDIVEHRASNNNMDPPSSLIICPSTLVGHWAFEIEKYIDASVITTLQYVGSTQERISLQDHFEKHNVIITSYDVVRKDIDYLGQHLWNYCILDEGHIIKNAKSKVTVAVKQLKAQNRLILSGTPIQNNVLDLWSLFDFLMPGFLGTERQFQATYGKPLLAARDSKCSAKDAEAGVLAMEALHKQVMPFLLRRMKDEVLSDLPEKIIQDRFCDLSPVQLKLYEQFSGSHVKEEISSIVKQNVSADTGEGSSPSPRASSHVFQALQYLLKLCSHPLLVIREKVPDSVKDLLPVGSDVLLELHKLHHSPKLVALHEILEECGIGVDASSSEGPVGVGQHRVLIFAQHKALLDIIEGDLFHTHMKNVTYLRLDGSVEPEKRFDIVKAFNSDPTIDVLLLTTHVGGLGLNLTSADTLVFMEHDWNPMRDLQAMDRAHRLGQRRVVNVYRLIMRGTLEEKVMSLQRFKLSVANTGPSTSKDLGFNFDGEPKKHVGGKGLKAILGGLEELWDQSQYAEEYNLSQFLSKLNG